MWRAGDRHGGRSGMPHAEVWCCGGPVQCLSLMGMLLLWFLGYGVGRWLIDVMR